MHTPNDSAKYGALGRRPIHPFPARMAPSIALEGIRGRGEQLTILDPMVGSGVVPAIARSAGHRAIGVDVDPLAVLISRVWTTPLDRDLFKAYADGILDECRSGFDSVPDDDAFPECADGETRRFVEYWFDLPARRQLVLLARAIDAVDDGTVSEALWCAFSRLIISKQSGASLAMDLSHGRPHRVFAAAPTLPFSGFLRAVDVVASNSIAHTEAQAGVEVDVRLGDARALSIADDSIDVVLTSPPYLNAIDYIRCSKFSLVWMGYSIAALRAVRSGSVGTEVGLYSGDRPLVRDILASLELGPGFPARQAAILTRYITDLGRIVSEVARVLKPLGHAVFVIGENTLRGFFIRNSHIVQAVADQVGLTCSSTSARELPPNRRYLPPPATAGSGGHMGARMRREVVLTFEKRE